jgi:hypothetical protein
MSFGRKYKVWGPQKTFLALKYCFHNWVYTIRATLTRDDGDDICYEKIYLNIFRMSLRF